MTLSVPLWLLIFAVSLAVLIKASEVFTGAAEKIGLRLGVPAFIIGGTIVALGTSLPELVSSIVSVVKGSPEIVLGNVVGSNITNILLVLGVAATLAKEIVIHHAGLRKDLFILVLATIFMGVVCLDGTFSFGDAIAGAVLLVLQLIYTVFTNTRPGVTPEVEAEQRAKLLRDAAALAAEIDIEGTLEVPRGEAPEHVESDDEAPNPAVLEAVRGPVGWRLPLTLLIAAVFIYGGAQWTIEAVIKLSDGLGVGKELIAITAVALGTSLPELVVTLSAALKGKAEIAVGNVLGSNLFNILYVLTIPGLIGDLPVPESIRSFGIPVLMFSTLAFVFVNLDQRVTRLEGVALLVFYVGFMAGLFLL